MKKIFRSKKFKSIISFILCFVLLLSPVLDTQAHAAVAAPWLVYALITYMAAVGVTFTVAGGVDAMIQAMEEKVSDYETQTGYKLFEIIEGGLSIQSPPDPPSGWDKNKGYFFLTAAAVQAITSFIIWLVSDGGWELGSIFSSSINEGTYTCYVNGSEYIYLTSSNPVQVEGTKYTLDLGNYYSIDWDLSDSKGTFLLNSSCFYYINSLDSSKVYFDGFYVYDTSSFDRSFNIVSSDSTGTSYHLNAVLRYAGYEDSDYSSIIGFTFCPIENNNSIYFKPFFVMDDGYAISIDDTIRPGPVDFTEFISNVSVDVPEEIPQLLPSSTEGVLLDTGTTAAETLEQLGETFEAIFTDTGTITQPTPQIITDPAQVVPTPVPTPVPSPEIEDIDDLGLPSLGTALFNKFPFSLPKDVLRIFEILTTDPVTPYWEVDLTGDALGIESNFVIDLSEYEAVGQISRWFSVISFSLFLILITKGMIKW